MGNTFIQDIRDKAAKKFLKVAFPDAEDVRTLKAALTLREKKIAEPRLVGPAAAIRKIAADNGLDLAGIPIVDPATDAARTELVSLLFEKRKAKGWTLEQSRRGRQEPPLLRRAPARDGQGRRGRRRQHLLDGRRHPGGHPHGRHGPRHLDRLELLHHGLPGEAPLLRRLRRRPQPDRRPAGRHRHHLGQELPGRDRRGAARGHALLLDQGLGQPRRRRQGRRAPRRSPRRRPPASSSTARCRPTPPSSPRSASASARAARSPARPTSSSSPTSTPATSATS